jgi:hypothetical protein
MNTQPQLRAFLTQTRVTVDLDPLSPTSTISLSLVHALDLPCIFTESGRQRYSGTLLVPTINVFYRSRLDFVVGHGLSADVVLGNDWMIPCQSVLLTDLSSIQ